MKIKLTKIKELNYALHPNKIKVGYEVTERVKKKDFKKPKLGKRFNLGTFSTSGVQEIIDKNTFITYSSVYRWEVIS